VEETAGAETERMEEMSVRKSCYNCKHHEKCNNVYFCGENKEYWELSDDAKADLLHDADPEHDAVNQMNRPDKDHYYLDIAQSVSKRSTCLRRQYGAVIVKNDEIIATGYNGAPRGEPNCCDTGECKRIGHAHNDGDYADCHSVHAEMNAIISASRSEMIGATLYLAGFQDGKLIKAEPCPVCARMIQNAGIIAVKGTSKNEE
jgi:dCMP deaminase